MPIPASLSVRALRLSDKWRSNFEANTKFLLDFIRVFITEIFCGGSGRTLFINYFLKNKLPSFFFQNLLKIVKWLFFDFIKLLSSSMFLIVTLSFTCFEFSELTRLTYSIFVCFFICSSGPLLLKINFQIV